jgi:hypothetical protein
MRVPAELVMRHVRQHVGKYESQGNAMRQPAQARYGLARDAGVKYDTLGKWLRGDCETLSLEDADRLLTAIGRPELWHADPDLSQVYEDSR